MEMENPEEIEQKKPVVKTDYMGGWGILLLEVAWIFIVHNFYPVFSMLAFGEGANSFMYTKTNFYIYLALIVVPPTILNIIKFIVRRKKQLPVGRYITAEVVVAIIFVAIIYGSFSWDF